MSSIFYIVPHFTDFKHPPIYLSTSVHLGHDNRIENTLSGLNNGHSFCTIPEARKSNIKVVTDSISGDSPFPGSWTAVLLMCPHIVEGLRELSGISFIWAPISFMTTPPPRPNHLPKAYLQIPSHWWLGFNVWICREGQNHSVYWTIHLFIHCYFHSTIL